MAQENGNAAPSADEIARDLRTLALVDRVIGLEAEVARLSSTTTASTGARDEVARLEGELRAVYGSRTWRVGTAVLRPARALRRVGRS
jgi:hypothetical protein